MLVGNPVGLIIGLALLALLPFLAVMVTSYVKLVVVFSLMRNALGVQQVPPNMVMNSMAILLTLFIMAPVGARMYDLARHHGLMPAVGAEADPAPPVPGGDGVFAAAAEGGPAPGADTGLLANVAARAGAPGLSGETLSAIAEPLRDFLRRHANPSTRVLFLRAAEQLWSDTPALAPDPEGFFILAPAFMLTELTEAFQIGFLLYLPFVVVDLIISNILLAMGMMMVSPMTISLPFKLLLFVMINGWTKVIEGLLYTYRPSA